jgi:putative chitinase
MITAEQLEKLHISADWVDPLNQAFEKFEINTPVRQAAFIGQCQHESGNFKTLQENLNYSAEALCRVWPSRFKSLEEAQPYHRNPDKIANKVYANRMGNGDEASGDGSLYKGRGLIQLTGAENYRNCGEAIGEDLLSSPDYLLSPRYAALSAAWFWHKNKLNTLADVKDWTTLTKRINGGTIGLDDRIKHIEHALSVLV